MQYAGRLKLPIFAQYHRHVTMDFSWFSWIARCNQLISMMSYVKTASEQHQLLNLGFW